MAKRYFRFRLDGQLVGLLRRDDDAKGIPDSLARVGDREWVEDADLYRHWVDPGDVELVEVDAAEARRAADGYGVKLEAASARLAPVEEDVP